MAVPVPVGEPGISIDVESKPSIRPRTKAWITGEETTRRKNSHLFALSIVLIAPVTVAVLFAQQIGKGLGKAISLAQNALPYRQLPAPLRKHLPLHHQLTCTYKGRTVTWNNADGTGIAPAPRLHLCIRWVGNPWSGAQALASVES
jgi:hypothetical protein